MPKPPPSRPDTSHGLRYSLRAPMHAPPRCPHSPRPLRSLRVPPKPPPKKRIMKRGIVRSIPLGVAVSASFVHFHHCILSFHFLRPSLVFISCSLGSCFLLWLPCSFFLRGVSFVLSGFASSSVLVLDPMGINLI